MPNRVSTRHGECLSLMWLFSKALKLVEQQARTEKEIAILHLAIHSFVGHHLDDFPNVTTKLKGQDLFVYYLHQYGEYMCYALFASTLSTRPNHLLKMLEYSDHLRSGIRNREEYLPFQNLLRWKKRDMLKIRNFGKKSIAEIETALAVYGLHLEMTEEEIAEIFS